MADAVERAPGDKEKAKALRAKERGNAAAVIGTAVLVKVFVELVFAAREAGVEIETKTEKLLERLTDPDDALAESPDAATLDAVEKALEELEAANEVGWFVSKVGVGGIGVALVTAVALPAAAAGVLAIGGVIAAGVGWRMSSRARSLLQQLRAARKVPRVAEDPSECVD
ncbi:hypothetical protein FNF31_03005 [Cafeteria roenbergensis]|uniref:Uncharacterized protein n=1 Tax=Cafeteria roenbergensis TaxID=33653 RepID=A0A5A8DGH0_CAFRO|nr:hypothetical protein FNF31_03005 [Cafeteria roenbergensis]KAA0164159.1 hypothetical protein FNF28_03972 [Cafeteria roenbergensis]